ncbi:hypothetical protein C8J57DRAFT_1240664 [Mycena rebaudengoi]|nr:hypothetical protein C8J57DRAFT_1240664 [Mycena rebaudengoi]
MSHLLLPQMPQTFIWSTPAGYKVILHSVPQKNSSKPLPANYLPDNSLTIRNDGCKESNMKRLGLKVLAINSGNPLGSAALLNEDLWTTARTHPNFVLSGPEQLKSADFEKALCDPQFFDRICRTGFNEVHLLNSWGASFHKDFQQM